jgi:cold shock protein
LYSFLNKKTPCLRRNKKMEGTVKWYNPRKGYGFISGEDGKDVFVHRSSIPEGTYLNEGDKVDYQLEDSERGPQATNIKKL